MPEYLHYTVGGYHTNGHPIDSGEYATIEDAREAVEYIGDYAKIYGITDSGAVEIT